ncbi:MAG: hypothetical protein U9N81_13815, partial [Bacillota bacterium]|nr:hypothetical protein [Bacillota bacterium]
FEEDDISLEDDGKQLRLQLNVDPDNNHFPLIRGTYYTLTIQQDGILLEGAVLNNAVELHFTTSWEGSAPVPVMFSSDIGGSDDIRRLETSQLNDNDLIYVTFQSPIRWSKAAESLPEIDRVKLYRMPRVEQIDDTDKSKFKLVDFDAIVPDSIDSVSQLEDVSTMDAVPLTAAEISTTNNRTIRITPAAALNGMHKYKLTIDKNMIEDVHGYMLDRDVETGLWAKASITSVPANWIGPEGFNDGQIIDNSQGTAKSYTVSGAPCYDPGTPIDLILNGEIVWKAQDTVTGSGAVKTAIINYDSFKTIRLKPSYDTDSQVALNKFEVVYYFSEGQKYTRIRIYPDTTLQPGTSYTLTIPADAFIDLGGRSPGLLTEQFTTAANSSADAKAIKLEKITFSSKDFYDGNEEMFILGSNFTQENPGTVSLLSNFGETLEAGLYFHSSDRLRLNISGDTARSFSSDDYAGTYSVMVTFSNNPVNKMPMNIGTFTITSKGKPELIARNPDSCNLCFDQYTINPIADLYGKTRYFIKLTYNDADGTLKVNESSDFIRKLRQGSVCASGGSQASMVDSNLLDIISQLGTADKKAAIDKYLFVKDSAKKQACLYLPIKLLRLQTTYVVTIADSTVAYNDEDGNDSFNWSFTTLSVPQVSGVSPSAIGEDYGADTFIMITGNAFYQGTTGLRVRFFTGNETDTVSNYSLMADRVEVAEGKNLKVYLPYSRERMKAGTYNITVLNGDQHKDTLYGAITVIPRSYREKPTDGQIVDTDNRQGDVVISKTSNAAILELSSRYYDRSFVDLDLDELMGQGVWERTIKLKQNKRDIIREIRTTSSYAAISFYGVRSDGSRENQAEIRAGRVAPLQSRILQSKLGRRMLHSDVIEATVSDLLVEAVRLDIPFRNSDGRNLKAMFYDSSLRKWQEVTSKINWIDGSLIIPNARPGFFAIVGEGER